MLREQIHALKASKENRTVHFDSDSMSRSPGVSSPSPTSSSTASASSDTSESASPSALSRYRCTPYPSTPPHSRTSHGTCLGLRFLRDISVFVRRPAHFQLSAALARSARIKSANSCRFVTFLCRLLYLSWCYLLTADSSTGKRRESLDLASQSPCPWNAKELCTNEADESHCDMDSLNWTDTVTSWLQPIVHLAEVFAGKQLRLRHAPEYWRSHAAIAL
jgi:hypothetical protein